MAAATCTGTGENDCYNKINCGWCITKNETGTCETNPNNSRPSKCTKYWSPTDGNDDYRGLVANDISTSTEQTLYEDDPDIMDDSDDEEESDDDDSLYEEETNNTAISTKVANPISQPTTPNTETTTQNLQSALVNSTSAVPGVVDGSLNGPIYDGFDGKKQNELDVGLDGVSYDENNENTQKDVENLFVYRPVSTWPTYTPRQPVCTPKIKRNARPIYTSGSSDSHFSYGTLMYGSNTQSLHNISNANMYSSCLKDKSSSLSSVSSQYPSVTTTTTTTTTPPTPGIFVS